MSDETTTTRHTVQELLSRIGSGDPEAIAELYSPSCDWKLNWPESEHGRSATPWVRDHPTPADHYRTIADHHIPEEVGTIVEHILVDGPNAVVMGEIRQTARPTGNAYRARFALHLTVTDGLITRHHVYEDSLAVAQAFEPTT
ncbi:nuclear transport factor 2 family protein [Nocardia nova]|uniref:nuclear transport factor 2 family protein n=1 Tax=Nocardia nova TaxID=37330 RepID=UPI00046CEC3A|nr:nuclear transport factor 2 family protein [Nocardia nova]